MNLLGDISQWMKAPVVEGQDSLTNLDRLAGGLTAFGTAISGDDATGITKDWTNRQEELKRKNAISGLMGQMGISGAQKGLLDTMPAAAQQAFLLQRMQQQEAERAAQARAGAAAAQSARQQAALAAQWGELTGGGQTQAAPSGYSMGELTNAMPPSAELSFGSEMPQTAPQADPGLSFGNIQPTPQAPVAQPTAYDRYRNAYERALSAPPGMIDSKVTSRLKDLMEFHAPAEVDLETQWVNGVGLINSETGQTIRPAPPAPVDQSEAEQEISRVQEAGFTRQQAILAKEGILDFVPHPVTKEMVLANRITGEIITPEAPQASQPAPAPIAQDPSQFSFGDRFAGGDQSFGAAGFGRGVANMITDSAGLGAVFPEASAGQSDFSVFREELTNRISSAYDGRVPAFLLQNIQELTPNPGTPFEGPEKAVSKLNALGRSMQGELRNVVASSGRAQSPADRERLSRQRQGLELGLQQIQEAIQGVQGTQGTSNRKTSSGVSWSVEP